MKKTDLNKLKKIVFKHPLLLLILILIFNSCAVNNNQSASVPKNGDVYNPIPKMKLLKRENGRKTKKMHFLVFGDSKGTVYFKDVLNRADSLQPDFCLTTADLVKKGGGESGKIDYKQLDDDGGWFMRKYPMWPTVGNHEESGGTDAIDNFSNFFGIKKPMYTFKYGNAIFIALPWPKIKDDKKKLKWLEKKLKSAKGKHIFIFKHRPDYDVGSKKYEDVEGIETTTTRLYDKYKVTAVFSGHDHIYYRTKRNETNYIISAGAGAPIYALKREKDAIKGDVYYGKRFKEDLKNSKTEYKFVAADGTVTGIPKAMYYVLSVKVDGDNVSIEMIDSKTGKIWDKATISGIETNISNILIAAHRGGYENDYKDRAPENSIANIQNAINHGFAIYESDVERTLDGKFIIMHDPTIDRTTNGSGEVAKLSSEEIKKYHLTYKNGKVSNEKIPFLADFISRGDGKIIFKIDFKPELKYLDDLIEEIKDLGLQDRVILRFKYKKEIAKDLSKFNSKELPSILFRVKTLKQYNELKSILDIKMISIFERKEFTPEQLQIIDIASKENIIVEAHTFNNGKKNREEYWEEQIELPITIFHTNKPILFQEFLKKK
jgi:glycerophosphoryl diester phosphodiesterase